jgi:hypothetical protein
MPNDKEKEIEGLSSLKVFFDQFGENDIYKQIFLEELFKFLYKEVVGKPMQDFTSCDDGEPCP